MAATMMLRNCILVGLRGFWKKPEVFVAEERRIEEKNGVSEVVDVDVDAEAGC